MQGIHIPIFFLEAVGSSTSGFPSAIFLGKIFLNPLNEANWKLSASSFSSNNTVCYKIKTGCHMKNLQH